MSALTKFYAENFKDGDDVLDICSSWVSHYPKDWKGGNVVGLGMNEYELSKNPQLSSFVVADLNKKPVLPFDDASFDKVTCVVSVDYCKSCALVPAIISEISNIVVGAFAFATVNKPLEIFKEIGRVLRPGGECYISMSNRWLV